LREKARRAFYAIKKLIQASRVVQRFKCAILGLNPVASRNQETHGAAHNWPSKDVLVPRHTSDSCGGPGAVQADTVARCTVSSDTLVWLFSGLSGHCGKKQCGSVGSCFRGRTALDLCLSRVRTRVAKMRQDCNYRLDTTKLGRERGKKFVKKEKKKQILIEIPINIWLQLI
jgi:hypothetical protein